MRAIVPLCIALLAFGPTRIAAQAAPPNALARLSAIRVRVDLKAPASAIRDTNALGAAVEQALLQHGWRILSLTDNPDAPLFFVGILVLESRGVSGVRIECTLTESVRRVRDGVVVAASTWTAPGQLSLVVNPAELSDVIRQGAVSGVTQFNLARGPLGIHKR